MALTKAQRAERRERVLEQIRHRRLWHGRRMELRLQRGRKVQRVTGSVTYIAPSEAYVLLVGDDAPVDRATGERRKDPLHVPVDIIRSVHPAK